MKAERKRVIVVDDSVDDAGFARAALAESHPDAEVLVFRSGASLRAYLDAEAEAGNPHVAHLVLLDLKLPQVGGHAVLQALRERYPMGTLPIVAFTSSTEPADVARAYALGANSYVVKPVLFEAYRELVSTVAHYWLEVNACATPGRVQADA